MTYGMAASIGLTPTKVTTFGMKLLWKKYKHFVFSSVILVSSIKIYFVISSKLRRKKWAEVGEDVVLLHSFPRGKYCPNISPFVLKLETYLRLAGIPYEIEYKEPMGPKGKCPWITLNGEEYTDSQFIIEMLSEKYNKDFSNWLSDKEKAIAHTFRVLVDEHFYWCNVLWRWVYDKNCHVSNITTWGTCLPFHYFYRPIVSKGLAIEAYMQGMGRHQYHEVMKIAQNDLSTLSDMLGENKYLMGSKMCEVDCAVFGLLAQIRWNGEGSPYLKLLEENYSNLIQYCDRIKDDIWPDWDQCLNPPIENLN